MKATLALLLVAGCAPDPLFPDSPPATVPPATNARELRFSAPIVTTVAGDSLLSIASGDFDGDGHLDLALGQWGFGARVLFGDGTGALRPGPLLEEGYSGSIAAGDFDRDGRLEFAGVGFYYGGPPGMGGGSIYRVRRAGRLSARPLPTEGLPLAVVAGDWNSDGRLDLAYSSDSDGVGILLGDGGGAFRSVRRLAVSAASLAVGDLDGDGRADLVAVAWYDPTNPGLFDGQIAPLLNRGEGRFEAMPELLPAAPPGSSPISVTVGDWNEDGLADVAVAGNGASVLVSDGRALHRLATYQPSAPGSQLRTLVEKADFDGDGHVDLVFEGDDEKPMILRGNGDGAFAASDVVIAETTVSASQMLAADVDGDGLPDLVLLGIAEVTVFLNRSR